MPDKAAKVRLFSEFPAVSTTDWKLKIEQDLKGSTFEKLVWKTLDGIDVQPFYRNEDIADKSYLQSFQGELLIPALTNNWEVRQDIGVDTVDNANSRALHAINWGATSLGFIIPETLKLDEKSFNSLLKGISIDSIRLNFLCPDQAENILNFFGKEVIIKGIEPDRIKAYIEIDPLGHLSTHGNFRLPEKQEFARAAEIIKDVSGKFPGLKLIGINTNIFHNAGASTVQELGLGLSLIAEYLQQLTGLNISVDSVAKAIQLNFAAGPVYFMEIAKLRTARLLFAQLVKAWGVTDENTQKTYIHTSTSEWTQTIYEPYTNILRSTTQSMSAILGGTNSLTVTPYDKAFRKSTAFSERIARNTQIILKEEAYFDKVTDPSSGTYFIESLTDSLAKHAWELFLQIEDEGGYLKTFKSGTIHKIIKETATARDLNIANRKDILIGINKYQNLSEKFNNDFEADIAFPEEKPVGNVIAEPLKKYRGAGDFEEVRMKTEKNKSGIPKVFLLTYGDQIHRRLRADFAAGFFRCGGFEVIYNYGFETIDEGIKAARSAKAGIVVLCSSDEEYPVAGPEALGKLPEGIILVIAGYPKNCVETLKSQGIHNYIHLKSNVLEELRKYQEILKM